VVCRGEGQTPVQGGPRSLITRGAHLSYPVGSWLCICTPLSWRICTQPWPMRIPEHRPTNDSFFVHMVAQQHQRQGLIGNVTMLQGQCAHCFHIRSMHGHGQRALHVCNILLKETSWAMCQHTSCHWQGLHFRKSCIRMSLHQFPASTLGTVCVAFTDSTHQLAFPTCILRQDTLIKIAKKLKKNSVAVDVVSFGCEAENDEKLTAFHEAVNSNNNSHLVSGLHPCQPHCAKTWNTAI